MFSVGIMQGRLSPPLLSNPQSFPTERWELEFELASAIGFDSIEWLYDSSSEESNPLLSARGRERILFLVDAHGVSVSSVCADYFKDNNLAIEDGDLRQHRSDLLIKVIEAAASIGAGCVLVPFLESSTLNGPDDRDLALEALLQPLDTAARLGVVVAVETDLPATILAEWLERDTGPVPGVYYDLGNAVALGYDPLKEIPRLASKIDGVHIKDRVLNGPNVPLGTGSVDFERCGVALAEIGYEGALVLETVRGDQYLDDATRNFTYVKRTMARSA